MIADNKHLEATIAKLEKELVYVKKQDPNRKYEHFSYFNNVLI